MFARDADGNVSSTTLRAVAARVRGGYRVPGGAHTHFEVRPRRPFIGGGAVLEWTTGYALPAARTGEGEGTYTLTVDAGAAMDDVSAARTSGAAASVAPGPQRRLNSPLTHPVTLIPSAQVEIEEYELLIALPAGAHVRAVDVRGLPDPKVTEKLAGVEVAARRVVSGTQGSASPHAGAIAVTFSV